MKNKSIPYRETHPLSLNVYLFFYIYVFIILIIANFLPASTLTYFLFLFLGIAGIGILAINFTYSVSIKENKIELFIKIPFKMTLMKLEIEDIESIEEINIDPHTSPGQLLKGDIFYFFKNGDAIKIKMSNGKIFIVSGVNAEGIIKRVKKIQSYK